jgi:hypothetical protein
VDGSPLGSAYSRARLVLLALSFAHEPTLSLDDALHRPRLLDRALVHTAEGLVDAESPGRAEGVIADEHVDSVHRIAPMSIL